MPNNFITDIIVSGSPYDLKDKNAVSVSSVTQSEYDNLPSSAKTSGVMFIITDATPVDVSQYWTSAQTQSAINQATSGKVNTSSVVSSVTSASTDSEIPTAKAVWEAASGGGTTYTAGRGISIANDTISFNLPISAGTGTNSVAEGSYTQANGNYSHAEGGYTTASGDMSHAEGIDTQANGNSSHAEGDSAKANGDSSHAEGNYTQASGDSSHAEGNYTSAMTEASHAEGNYTKTTNKYEHASGQFNASNKASNTFGDSGNTLFSVGNGTANNARHNAFEIRQNGDIYLSLNGQDVKLQDQLGGSSITVDTALDSGSTNPVENRVIYNKIDEIEQVTARALNELNEEVSEKQDTLVSGTNIKTINNTSILGSGNIDIQGGGTTYTAGRGIDITNDTVSVSLPISAGTGTNSIAEGSYTIASGSSSHAEGYTTSAMTYYSHAEGYKTQANGYYSHAEGSETRAIGESSHAEGYHTTASGSSSHAEGYGTIAIGQYSHAEGYGTIANNYAEHASGKFNVSSSASTTFCDSGNTLFSVGNGTANNARHNAFEIRQNGDIYLSSGGTDIKLQDHLGGTASSAITSGDTNAVAGGAVYDKIDEIEQVTAASLNALNDNFGGLKLVKLTQAEYNTLTTKDSSTLYIIVN